MDRPSTALSLQSGKQSPGTDPYDQARRQASAHARLALPGTPEAGAMHRARTRAVAALTDPRLGIAQVADIQLRFAATCAMPGGRAISGLGVFRWPAQRGHMLTPFVRALAHAEIVHTGAGGAPPRHYAVIAAGQGGRIVSAASASLAAATIRLLAQTRDGLGTDTELAGLEILGEDGEEEPRTDELAAITASLDTLDRRLAAFAGADPPD